MTDVPAALDVPSFGDQDVSDHTVAKHLHRAGDQWHGTALCAVLDHDTVSSSRVHQPSTFKQVVALRFLDIHMLASLASQDGGRGVPMIGRCDDHRCDRLVVEHPPQITGHVIRPRQLLKLGCPRRVWIASPSDADMITKARPQTARSASTTDEGDVLAISHGGGERSGRGDRTDRGRGTAAQKLSTG